MPAYRVRIGLENYIFFLLLYNKRFTVYSNNVALHVLYLESISTELSRSYQFDTHKDAVCFK